jgi:PAS domain S-box-containing protein
LDPGRGSAGDPSLLEAAFAAAPAAVAVAGAGGRLIAVNPASCELVGRSQTGLIGHSPREFTHPEDIASDDEGREMVAGERSECTLEERYIRPDGMVTGVRVHLAPTSDPSAGAPLVVVHVTDVGAGKHHRQALAEAEERFRSAFDNAPIGMALVAPDGRWLRVNPALSARSLGTRRPRFWCGPSRRSPIRTISTPTSLTSRMCSPAAVGATRWRSATTTPTATSSG